MAFQAETLQPQLVARFNRFIARQELAHAYLLVGPSGSGKRALATWLALRLFCQHVVDGEPDGTCPECQRILSGNHPDVIVAQADGRQIKVDQVRHLKAEFTKTGMEGATKLFIIEDAETLTTSAANSLLKFIEEPGPGVYILMLTTNKNAVLPTIQSRTQLIELLPLPAGASANLLGEAGVPEYLQPLMLGITSSPAQAKELMADDWFEQAARATVDWFKAECRGDYLSFVMVASELVPLAKDRQSATVPLDLLALVWRDALMVKNQVDLPLHFAQWAGELQQATAGLSDQQVLAASGLSLTSKKYLDQNINFQTVAEQLTLQQLQAIQPLERGINRG